MTKYIYVLFFLLIFKTNCVCEIRLQSSCSSGDAEKTLSTNQIFPDKIKNLRKEKYGRVPRQKMCLTWTT